MEVQWVLVAHALVTLLVVVSFLCGNWPIFHGTFVHKIHHFITFAAYDYFLRFIAAILGPRGRDAVLSVEYYCCDRPNPSLQILYLATVGGTYFIIVNSSFSHIPSYYISEYHRYTSILAVGVGVLLFLLTSFTDPGIVKPDNVSSYISAYPYDNILYAAKECPTCKILKPARSKHCSICDCCVARFDHHCGWMNKCIGEKNTRFFIGFLFWHFFLCLYGVVVLGLILAGQLKEKKVLYILTAFYGVDNTFSALAPPVVQWLLSSYNTQILLMVFLTIVSLLLAGFLGYHTHLCLTNTTTNETFKWQDYISCNRKLIEARASAAALKASLRETNGEVNVPPKTSTVFSRKCCPKNEAELKNNMYDRGVFHNLLEVFFPLSRRSSFSNKKSD